MLPRPEIESLERQSLENDLARYRDLSLALSAVPADMDSLRFQSQWAELEQIKNRHGGMPPEKH